MESAQGQLQVRFAPVTVKWAIEMTNKFSYSPLVPSKPIYPIPDQNGQSLYLFSLPGVLLLSVLRDKIRGWICEILRIF